MSEPSVGPSYWQLKDENAHLRTQLAQAEARCDKLKICLGLLRCHQNETKKSLGSAWEFLDKYEYNLTQEAIDILSSPTSDALRDYIHKDKLEQVIVALKSVIVWRNGPEGPEVLFTEGAAMLKRVEKALASLTASDGDKRGQSE